MNGTRPDDAAPVPAYDVLGRLGSWHSHRWLFFLGGLFFFLLVPWQSAERVDLLVQLNVLVGLAWAVPCWCAGVTATRRGVRFNYGLFVRRIHWEEIEGATVAWHGVDPRLRIDLVDDEERWAPGFHIPLSQRSSRQDGWRHTEMFRAAQLITAEADRRRHQGPPDGTVQPVPRPTLRPAHGLGTAA